MVLWFGFEAPAALVAQQCVDYSWTFSYFPLCPHLPSVSRPRVGKKLVEGRTQWRSLTWTGQRDILYHTASCTAIKTGGRGRKGETGVFQVGGCSENTWTLVCLWDLLPLHHLVLFAGFFIFPSLFKLSLNPQVSLLSLFWFSDPSCWCRDGVGAEWAAGWDLGTEAVKSPKEKE